MRLVTGGGTGIGRGIADCLAGEGAVVTIAARRLDVLEQTAEQLRGEVAGAEIRVAVCDVTVSEQVEAAVAIGGFAGRPARHRRRQRRNRDPRAVPAARRQQPGASAAS